jgi:hypothetical protein
MSSDKRAVMAGFWRRRRDLVKSLNAKDFIVHSAEKCRFIHGGGVFWVFPPKLWVPGKE